MRPYDVILKKRNGYELTFEEISFLVDGYVRGDIPDHQMAAFCMAVFFQGLNLRETADLTTAMVNSGERLDLSAIPGLKVDKHSTGGVGDKTTLVVVPLVASQGVPVAKMSGRGLGHTGGTIDKLESIPGLRIDLTVDEFIDSVKRAGAAVVAQTGNLVPADKKLYALRDVTATVDSLPLIASSIMSKKVAAGCNALVLDVKVGSGAFMKKLDDARKLAEVMLDIGLRTGIKTSAVLTSMNQPLGLAVGNALEVKEAVAALRGEGPADLEELCLEVAAQMVLFSKKEYRREEILKTLKEALRNGSALDKFKDIITSQGGDPRIAENPSILPSARESFEVAAGTAGYVQSINSEQIGSASMILGAGRSKKDDPVDPSAGIIIRKKVGNFVLQRESIAVLYYNSQKRANVDKALELVRDAFVIGEGVPEPEPLIIDIIN